MKIEMVDEIPTREGGQGRGGRLDHRELYDACCRLAIGDTMRIDFETRDELNLRYYALQNWKQMRNWSSRWDIDPRQFTIARRGLSLYVRNEGP